MDELRASITRHEGVREKPYKCTAGKTSIGIGRNLDDTGVNADEIELMLTNDINRSQSHAETYRWFTDLADARQRVVIEMIFQMGLAGFARFRRMIAAIERGDFASAANEMLDSKWAKQCPERAKEMSLDMAEG